MEFIGALIGLVIVLGLAVILVGGLIGGARRVWNWAIK